MEQPRVAIIGSQQLDFAACNAFLKDHALGPWEEQEPGSEAERLVEFSGRVCYTAYGDKQGRKKNAEYIDNILTSGHFSVIEHAVWTVLISGVSRTLTHELIRHRHLSVSEISQRYVDCSDIGFVLPDEIAEDSLEHQIWREGCHEALELYQLLYENILQSLKESHNSYTKRDRRIRARQAARSLLPGCTETMIVVTGNARTFRHILALRGSLHAEREIRKLSLSLLKVLREHSPNLFKDFSVQIDESTGEQYIVQTGQGGAEDGN